MKTGAFWKQEVFKIMASNEYKSNKLAKKLAYCFTKFLEFRDTDMTKENKFMINFKNYLKEQLKNAKFKKVAKELEIDK